MKKKHSFFALGVALAGFTACEPGHADQYFAALQDARGNTISEVVLYADQDSAHFYVASSDPWTGRVEADWAKMTPSSFKKGGYAVPVKITPTSVNNTGGLRKGRIVIQGRQDLSLVIFHTYWHNIETPRINAQSAFETTFSSADSTYLPLVFTTYQQETRLTSTDKWVHTPDSVFKAGRHQIKVPIGKNASAERTATITLMGKDANTVIKVTQPKKANS